MAEQPTCRGYMFQSTKLYIESTYDEATRNAIYARLAPRTREILASFDKVAWYPVSHASEIYEAIAKHHQETDKQAEKALFGIGRTIAETATSTFLRLLLKFMTVQLFSRKVPDFWARDNRCGSLATETLDLEGKRMTLVHRGMGAHPYIGGVAPGFLCHALQAIGCKGVRAESNWRIDDPAPDVIRYEVAWD